MAESKEVPFLIGAFNRVELIDKNGRAYTHRGEHVSVEYQIQDDGRTLKIFLVDGIGLAP